MASRSQGDEPNPVVAPARSGTLVVTNLTKVVGLAIGVKAGLLDSNHDTATMAFAAFLCTGAQISERVMLALIDRFFGPP